MRKVYPAFEYESETDTRFRDFDPMISYIRYVARIWPRAVDEGSDAVLELAREYEWRDVQVAFFHAVAQQLLKGYRFSVSVQKYGDSPGGPPYLSVTPEGDHEQSLLVYFNEIVQVGPVDFSRPIKTSEGSIVWMHDSDVDNLDVPYMTIERVVALLQYMADKHKPSYESPSI